MGVLYCGLYPGQHQVYCKIFLDNFRKYVNDLVTASDVYLIFDRYIPTSRKECLRKTRDLRASRKYQLNTTMKIPPQKVVLTVSENKCALVELVCEDLLKYKDDFLLHRLVITGSQSVPVELYKGLIIQRQDLKTTQEEGDTIILHHLSVVEPQSAVIIADDTDIFVLLCHFLQLKNIKSQVYMVSPIRNRSVIDINKTVSQNDKVVDNLLAMHGLTGCDTVAPHFGIGKSVAIKVLKKQTHSLDLLGDTSAVLNDVIHQSKKFILVCYGEDVILTANETMYKIWLKKVSKNITSALRLQTLPPTDEALNQNILLAHIQIAIWRNSLEPDPPALDPQYYGWYLDDGSLSPVMLPPHTAQAPEALLKVIKCSCKGDRPCNTRRRSCYSSGMACTVFCHCAGNDDCWNHHTRINGGLVGNGSENDL